MLSRYLYVCTLSNHPILQGAKLVYLKGADMLKLANELYRSKHTNSTAIKRSTG